MMNRHLFIRALMKKMRKRKRQTIKKQKAKIIMHPIKQRENKNCSQITWRLIRSRLRLCTEKMR